MEFFKRGSKLWMLGAVFLLPISFFVALPWLNEQPKSVVFWIGGLASVGTVAISLLIAVRKDSYLDEWGRKGARFASHWGWLAGAAIIVALLAIPPFRDLISDIAGQLGDVTDPDERLVLMSFILGFCTLVLAQTVCTLALGIIWRFWMTRAD